MHILIVEDSALVASGIKAGLELHGFTCDMAVNGPSSGPLEQLMFEVCRWSGHRNPAYGGWIIPRNAAQRVLSALDQHCTKIAN